MKPLQTYILLAVLLLCPAALASAADPTGHWSFDFESRQGRPVHATFTLQVEGNALTGTFDGPNASHPISNGRVTGDTVTFQVTREARRGRLTSEYSGQLSGDTLTGTVRITGPRGKTTTRPWTATRVK